MSAEPQPDQQVEFLRAVFGEEVGYLFIGRLNRQDGTWTDRSFVYPLQTAEALNYANVCDMQGFEAYVAAQLYGKPDSRKKDFVKTCPSAWSDLDTASPYGVTPEPSVILETSPGRYHGFWRTPRPMEPAEAEDLSRRIAYAYHREGADLGGWDLTQVLRIPGTKNKKYPNRPVVKLLKCDPTPIPLQAFEHLRSAPARTKSPTPGAGDSNDPPVKLLGFDLEHWQKQDTTDRSGWAMRMVSILKENGLSDHLVEVALATHPIYLAKAREKWGNRESLINDDIRRCIQRWKDNPPIEIELPPGGISVPGYVEKRRNGTVVEQRAASESSSEAVYPIQTLAQLMSKPMVEAEQLVEGLLWAGRTHWWFSDPNVGKTLILLAMGLHISAGRSFCGLQVKQGAVLLIEEDSSLSVLTEYVDMLCEIYGFDLESLPFYVNEIQGLRITNVDGRAVALAAIKACPKPLELIIWDTAERLVPSETFTSRELDQFGQLLQWAVNQGISNTVVDHTKKPPPPPKGVKPKPITDPAELVNLLYGARAKGAISDVMTHFGGGLKSGNVKATFCKMRGELPASVDIQFQPDTGFTIQAPPRATRTPTEQRIVKWLNSRPVDWYLLGDIIAGADVTERSGKRAVIALKGRRLIEKDEERSDRSGAMYRLRAAPEAVFA
jgi:hypothetical protein